MYPVLGEDGNDQNNFFFPQRVYNILVLGETGTGKTTTLGAISTYLKYPSWREVTSNPNLDHLTTKVKYQLYREGLLPLNVDMGTDNNEVHQEAGASVTQQPKIHVVNHDGCTFNFIDVPGSGDTRGIRQDEANTSAIVTAAKKFDQIHMILIFMKASEERLTVQVKYTLGNALSVLHKDNINQIGFVFTHTAADGFTPGAALHTLKAFFEELRYTKNIRITVDKSSAYAVDNDGFRIACALKQHPDLVREKNIEGHVDHWTHSRREILRLLQDVREKAPKETLHTLSIIEARLAAICLIEPLAATTNAIQANIRDLEDNPDKVVDMIVTQGIQQEYCILDRQLAEPMTVCTSPACCERVKISEDSDEMATVYPRPCHEACYQSHIPLSVIGDEGLRGCEIFDILLEDQMPGDDTILEREGFCKNCDHRYSTHQHVKIDRKRAVRARYHQQTDVVGAQNILQARLGDLKAEQDRILLNLARLGRYLSENAILTYNDATRGVLEAQIQQEEAAGNNAQVDRLRVILQEYVKKQETLVDAERSGNTVDECPTSVKDIINELYALPINGNSIQTLFEAEKDAHNRHAAHTGIGFFD